MPTANDFRTLINSRGVHHNCYYDIVINVPTLVVTTLNSSYGIALSGSTLADYLNTFCTEVNVPSTSIASAPIRVGGEAIEIPYDRLYGEFQTTFYVDAGADDSGGATLKTIQAWIDTIYPPFTRNFAYPDEYTTTIDIKLYTLNRDKNDMLVLRVMQAWPSSIQAAQLSGRTGNEPTSFVVTWKYRYLIPESLQRRIVSNVDIDNFIESAYSTVKFANTNKNFATGTSKSVLV